MFKKIKAWFQKKALKWGAGILEDKIEDYEKKEPRIGELRLDLYSLTMQQFLEKYSGVKISEKSLVQHIKDLMDPLKDEIEDPIETIIDVLDPRS